MIPPIIADIRATVESCQGLVVLLGPEVGVAVGSSEAGEAVGSFSSSSFSPITSPSIVSVGSGVGSTSGSVGVRVGSGVGLGDLVGLGVGVELARGILIFLLIMSLQSRARVVFGERRTAERKRMKARLNFLTTC